MYILFYWIVTIENMMTLFNSVAFTLEYKKKDELFKCQSQQKVKMKKKKYIYWDEERRFYTNNIGEIQMPH